MQTYATAKAVEKFTSLQNSPKSSIYIDTCFCQADNEHPAIGLEFLLAQKDAILRSGKRIIVIHYVAEELRRKQSQGHRWAHEALNTILRNTDIFEVRKKSDIEKELDSSVNKCFADEALRRIAIADASRGYQPALLTADYACALAVATNVYSSVIFILDRVTAGTPTVRRMPEFMERFKGLYAIEYLSGLFSRADIVLTSSALRRKEFTMFLKLLKRITVQGEKLPVYIHESSLRKTTHLPALFQELMPHLHLVPNSSYTDEFSWMQASFAPRSSGRDIVIIGSAYALASLKEKLDNAKNFHTNRRVDCIKYYQIAPLGTLKGIQSLNHSTSRPNTVSVENLLSAADEELPAGTAVPDIIEAAHKGNTRAMGVLSSMYEHGYAVRQSSTMAFLWKERRDAITARRKQHKQQAANPNPSLLSRFKYFVADVDCYIKRTLTQLVLIK